MHLSMSELIAIRRFILFSTVFFATAITSYSQTAIKIDPIKGIYFGQTLPGETPVLFAPEVLQSVSVWVEATAFSPDGSLFFLAVGDSAYSSAKLYYSKCVNNVWTPFSEPTFLSGFTFSHEPVFSADGTTLTFTGKKGTGTLDLWTVRYTAQGWDTPVAMRSPINSNAKEYRGSYMADATLLFGSSRSGMMQIYKANNDTSRVPAVELVGPPISTKSYEGDPCIASDGRFLIFYSARDGKSSDLYVSFREAKGAWGTPINLGDKFNSSSDEYGAHLSTDTKYLFFTRHTSTGNSIYWVASSAIEKLNPAAQENVTIGKYRKLESKILEGEVSYLEHLPDGYGETDKQYPVVLLMNAQNTSAFANAAATIDHLSNERIPDMILIGISNTGVAEKTWACPDSSGNVTGAAKFSRFLEEDLLPEIKKSYRTNGYKILMGESNAGLLVLYGLLTRPGLFDAYVVASPMLGWCPDFFMNKTKSLFETKSALKNKLYVSYGDLDYVEVTSTIHAFEDILKNQSPTGLKAQLDLIKNCGHVPQVTLNNALLFFFSECTMTAERKQFSVQKIKAHFENISKEYGFTVWPKEGMLIDIAADLKNGKQFDKAIDLLNYLVSLYPNSAMNHYVLGVTLYEKGDIASAKESLNESIRIDSNFIRAKRLLARISK
jgi:predicted alpha/beta superfamily hydrolase/Tol biopolymer transport system component